MATADEKLHFIIVRCGLEREAAVIQAMSC
jgi:hypothetical protein